MLFYWVEYKQAGEATTSFMSSLVYLSFHQFTKHELATGKFYHVYSFSQCTVCIDYMNAIV